MGCFKREQLGKDSYTLWGGVGDRFIIGWSLQRLLRIHKLQSFLLSGLIYRTHESVQVYCVVSFSADI